MRSQKKNFFYSTRREKTRLLSFTRLQFQFGILTRISRLINANTNSLEQKNVIYFNMFEYFYNSFRETQTQS